MLGSIIGDVVGSVYEYANVKREDFPLFKLSSSFTDDTVMTAAVADAILSRLAGADETAIRPLYAAKLREWGRRYPEADYGGGFRAWLRDDSAGPYNSYGNGSAIISKTRCARRSRSGETAIPWPASPAGSLRPITRRSRK